LLLLRHIADIIVDMLLRVLLIQRYVAVMARYAALIRLRHVNVIADAAYRHFRYYFLLLRYCLLPRHCYATLTPPPPLRHAAYYVDAMPPLLICYCYAAYAC